MFRRVALQNGKHLRAIGTAQEREREREREREISIKSLSRARISRGRAFPLPALNSAKFPHRHIHTRYTHTADQACGEEPVPYKPQKPLVNKTNTSSSHPDNATVAAEEEIPLAAEGGMCAQVLLTSTLPPEIASGQNWGTVAGRALNASGHGMPNLEICLGWDDVTDGLDEFSEALREMRALNPVAAGVYGLCLENCSLAQESGNITDASERQIVCLETCQAQAVRNSNRFCNVTDRTGHTTIRGAPFPYPVGLMRWRLFVRDPFDDARFPRSFASWARNQCLRQRLGRTVHHPPDPLGTGLRGRGGGAAVCRSADYWSRVSLSTTIRYLLALCQPLLAHFMLHPKASPLLSLALPHVLHHCCQAALSTSARRRRIASRTHCVAHVRGRL